MFTEKIISKNTFMVRCILRVYCNQNEGNLALRSLFFGKTASSDIHFDCEGLHTEVFATVSSIPDMPCSTLFKRIAHN